MRIVENTERVTFVQELKGVVCNCCGEVFDPSESDLIHQFSPSFGYGSSFDLESWTFDICETCLVKIVKDFKVPHYVRENIF